MDTLENKMIDILVDLKENHHAECIKAEFETEGTTFEQAVKLKKISDKAGLDLAIKIGGCEAVKDMYEAQSLCAAKIIAPMIETPYALKKYVRAAKKVFTSNEKLYINIETVTGYNNLQDIILTEEFSDIAGVVFGRNDMVTSMDLPQKNTDSDFMLNIGNNMSVKMKEINKELTVGGNISPASLTFLSKISYLTGFETRKIIFNAQKSLTNTSTATQGIIKALDFEALWLKDNLNNYGTKIKEYEQRLKLLEERAKSLISS